MVMRGMWEEKGSSDTRLMLEPLIPNDSVFIGSSKRGGHHREHVVPRRAICIAAHELLKQGISDLELSRFIWGHVAIAKVHEEECQRMDRKAELGLRQLMPKGWTFEHGSLLARLEVAGVVLMHHEDAQRERLARILEIRQSVLHLTSGFTENVWREIRVSV